MPKKSADPEIIANSSSVNVGSLKVDLVGGEKLDVNGGDVDWSEDYAWDGRGYLSFFPVTNLRYGCGSL